VQSTEALRCSSSAVARMRSTKLCLAGPFVVSVPAFHRNIRLYPSCILGCELMHNVSPHVFVRHFIENIFHRGCMLFLPCRPWPQH